MLSTVNSASFVCLCVVLSHQQDKIKENIFEYTSQIPQLVERYTNWMQMGMCSDGSKCMLEESQTVSCVACGVAYGLERNLFLSELFLLCMD